MIGDLKVGEAVRTAAIQNLGCSKNQIDGERISAFLENIGVNIVDDFAAADIIVVNTCAFIKEAQEEAIENILEMAALRKSEKKGRCGTLIVSGCFSERYRDKIKKDFPEVDVWAGVNDWAETISSSLKTIDANNDAYPLWSQISQETLNNDFDKRILSEPLSTQYIKIAEGCSHKCSFCVIPSIRGKFKSRSEESILKEAEWLYDQGARELILVAQDTSSYGRDIGANLTRLLESLLKKTDFPWIRTMYLHPQLIDDDLLNLMATEERICRYFDIPLQHISDTILTAMNRRPLSAGVYELIERIREKLPDATLRTSFIIGFPSETSAQFNELKHFVQTVRFDKLGVFPFSSEDGTPAHSIRPRPNAAVVQKRCEELMGIQQNISWEILESKVGKNAQIIIDRISDAPDFNYEGRTMGDAPEIDGRVFIKSGDFAIGQIITEKITGASDYDLFCL